MRRILPCAVVAAALSACAMHAPMNGRPAMTEVTAADVVLPPRKPAVVWPSDMPPPPGRKPGLQATPYIHAAQRPLQCVPYARAVSGVEIYGDAWTWWGDARGRYTRGRTPRVGAVVLLSTGPRRGHVAVVTEVRGPREIVVDHANWLNQGRIHRNTPMRDVSPRNDWSAVRVWYTPGKRMGANRYPVTGFIYPERLTAAR